MRLRSVHPGVTVDEVRDATGFELVVSTEDVAPDPRADRRGAAAASARCSTRAGFVTESCKGDRADTPQSGTEGSRALGAPEPHPALRTALCECVGVRYPIVQTGMGWVAGPRWWPPRLRRVGSACWRRPR